MLFRRAKPSFSAGGAKPGPALKTAARPPVQTSEATPRTDWMIAGGGVALAVTCALFPWYIFFNQDQFGPPKVTFEGTDVEAIGSAGSATPQMARGLSDVRIVDIPNLDLDYAPTGSLRRAFAQPQGAAADQPLAEQASPFRVLHVTAGRAMIEDDSGIWVVQRGSRLPDKSRVEKIERRAGKWVVVTSDDKVLVTSD